MIVVARINQTERRMFFDEAFVKTALLLAMFVISFSLILGSRHQPFPEISNRFGWIVCTLAVLLTIGEQAPRPMSLHVLLMTLLSLGTFGILIGVHHLVRTRRDVFIAPMAGFLFCLGATGLMVEIWPQLTTLEEWAGFLLLVVLGGGQTWLVFRGLLIGRLPLAWSQAGMVALQRGHLHGPHGALACFERGWDAEEEHLNPMAYVALYRINTFLQQLQPAQQWLEAFEDAGGADAVAEEWVHAIDQALDAINATQ